GGLSARGRANLRKKGDPRPPRLGGVDPQRGRLTDRHLSMSDFGVKFLFWRRRLSRRVEAEAARRRVEVEAKPAGTAGWRRLLTLLILVGLTGLVGYELLRYTDWPPAAYSDPDVLNLTAKGQVWEVTYGPPGHPRVTKQAVLPVHEFP